MQPPTPRPSPAYDGAPQGCRFSRANVTEHAHVLDVVLPDGTVGTALLQFLRWYTGGHGSTRGPDRRPFVPRPPEGVDAEILELFARVPSRRGVLAAQFGNHYNDPERANYAPDLAPLLRGLDAWARRPGNTGVAIEVDRQFFGSDRIKGGSSYFSAVNGGKGTPCVVPGGPHSAVADWRNGDVWDLLQRENLSAVLPLPTYSASVRAGWATLPGRGDCTHHCPGPQQYEPIWRSLRSIAEAGPTGGPL